MGQLGGRRRRLRADPKGKSKQGPSRPLRLFTSQTERRLLLAGTALVSTLAVAMPAPASAQQAVNIVSVFPVNVTNNDDCIFIGTCASIITGGIGASINFTNRGDFATAGIGAIGINLITGALGGSITLKNSGDIATAGLGAIGINAITAFPLSSIKNQK